VVRGTHDPKASPNVRGQEYPSATKQAAAPARAGVVDFSSNHQRRTAMKSGMKDKVEGKLHEAKGKIKEVAGRVSGKPDLEAEGTYEKVSGKIQGKVGQIKTVLGK
jgi:uncharacterized protein YjbJ (UPF0337 family)